MVAAKRYRSKQPSASEPPTSPNATVAALATRNEAAPSPGTAAQGASQRSMMPNSTLNRTRTKPSAPRAAMARPTANAKRESLPGSMSASPRAARHKAPTGLIGGKPEPQVDNSGSPVHQPMSTTAAIVTAAKPAA